MFLSLGPFFYRVLIDPLVADLHKAVLDYIKPSYQVLDVACGPGTLALAMAQQAGHVTGIDLSAENIEAAQRTTRQKGADHVHFEIRDAAALSCYHDKQFDLAVISMAIHQFEAGLALKILIEMKRIAGRLVLMDYNHHMPRGWRRSLAWSIERMAGGDHFRNFRTYLQLGGIHHFARQAGITIHAEAIRGGGVFLVIFSKL